MRDFDWINVVAEIQLSAARLTHSDKQKLGSEKIETYGCNRMPFSCA
jgi:hypothetical protein